MIGVQTNPMFTPSKPASVLREIRLPQCAILKTSDRPWHCNQKTVTNNMEGESTDDRRNHKRHHSGDTIRIYVGLANRHSIYEIVPLGR